MIRNTDSMILMLRWPFYNLMADQSIVGVCDMAIIYNYDHGNEIVNIHALINLYGMAK